MTRHRLDYLIVGHVTQDRMPEGGFTVGGTAAYAARTAKALGLRVGVITSGAQGLELNETLPDIEILQVPAQATTTFDNRYTPAGRVQTIKAVAAPLTPDVVPPSWQAVGLVHLGPVARECDPALVDLFPDAFLGLTPQGWMRCWDETGRVRTVPWENAEALLPQAHAVVLSGEDVGSSEALIADWAGRTRVLAVTRGAAGCTVHAAGTTWNLSGFPAAEVDPTGSGDIFAGVFFTRLWQGDAPPTAAQLANCIAAISVTRSGLSGTPTLEEVAHCRGLCV